MDANYIYDIFEITRERETGDLGIGLAMLQEHHPIPEGMTERKTMMFVGQHYKELVAAYKKRDRDVFTAAVRKAEQEDAEWEAKRKAEGKA